MNRVDITTDNRTFCGAIIGLGRMGLTHLAILNGHPQVRSLSFVESSACFGRAVEKNLGFTYYATVDELFQAGNPDFVVIATPTDSHYAIASAALQRGVDVFVEKPLTMSAAESGELAYLARANHAVAQVGYVNRFNEVFQAVHTLLQTGVLGEITHVECEIRSPMVMKTTGSSWRSRHNRGGGCLSDIATHGIDLMNFFVESPPTVVGASLQSLVSESVEDRVDVLFAYDGPTGCLHVNWSDPSCRKPAYKVSIDAVRGRITADHHTYKVFKRKLSGAAEDTWTTEHITDIGRPVRVYLRGNEFTRQLDYFIDSIGVRRVDGINNISSAMQVDQVIEQVRGAAHIVRIQ